MRSGRRFTRDEFAEELRAAAVMDVMPRRPSNNEPWFPEDALWHLYEDWCDWCFPSPRVPDRQQLEELEESSAKRALRRRMMKRAAAARRRGVSDNALRQFLDGIPELKLTQGPHAPACKFIFVDVWSMFARKATGRWCDRVGVRLYTVFLGDHIALASYKTYRQHFCSGRRPAPGWVVFSKHEYGTAKK